MLDKSSIITHRGLEPSNPNFYSESSFEAFEDHLSRGFGGIEFDLNPTLDGFIIMHDATLNRPTDNKDNRIVSELNLAETRNISLPKGKIPSFVEIMNLIKIYPPSFSALHLKARLQTPKMIERFIVALAPFEDIFSKFIVFDVKAETIITLKKTYPKLRLAPSVAHPFDIKRFNDSIGQTLMSIEEALRFASKGLIDGVWGDEWDTTAKHGERKLFYTPENFRRLHDVGLFIAVVTPELHGTSPGLYGGESHPDAKDLKTLMNRIKQIIIAGADYFCTDYPEELATLKP